MTGIDPILEHPSGGRFELDVGGLAVFALARRRQGTLVISHVEAPHPLRGTGAAGRLMEGLAGLARREGLRIVPLCGYAAAWLRRHRQHRDLLA